MGVSAAGVLSAVLTEVLVGPAAAARAIAGTTLTLLVALLLWKRQKSFLTLLAA